MGSGFSVLIIVKNRADHLRNVLKGIEKSSILPNEVIVVHMNEPSIDIAASITVRQFTISSEHPLPLAAARNAAAEHATSELLIFLDVDCIPAPTTFETLLADLQAGQLVMADPRYITQPVQDIDFEVLARSSRINPARASLVYGQSSNYGMFWSLGFAISKSNFQKIAGFDEAYTGYGGEDTDFALRAKQAEITLFYSKAKVYHQNHPSYDPPLNWLADIVANAQQFYKQWHVWPMEGWLHKFQEAGYISWTKDSITVTKLPTDSEIKAAQKPDAL